MKKILSIFLIFLVLVIIFIANLPLLFKLLQFDEQLKVYLIKELAAGQSDIVKIEKIEMNLNTIRIKNIDYKSHVTNPSFIIKEILFKYNIISLVTDLNKPYKSIYEVAFVSPEVIIRNIEKNEQFADNIDQDTLKVDIFNTLTNFENIDRINIKNGIIYYEKEKDINIVLAKGLNGWLESINKPLIKFQVEGNIFQSNKNNIDLSCTLNLISKNLSSTVRLKNYDLGGNQLFKDNQIINVNQGFIDSNIEIEARQLNSLSFNNITVNGNIVVKDLSGTIYRSKFEQLNCFVQIENNKLNIHNGEFFHDKANFIFTTEINDVFHPVFKGSIASSELKLESIGRYLNFESGNGNTIQFSSNYSYSADNFFMNIQLKANHLHFDSNYLNNIYARLVLDKKQLKIQVLNFNFNDYSFVSNGTIDLENSDYKYHLNTKHKFGEHKFFNRLTNATQFINLDLRGNINNKNLYGNWAYYIRNQKDSLFYTDGVIHLLDGIFTFSMRNSSEKDFNFSIQVSDIFKNPAINYGYIENLPVQNFTDNEWVGNNIKKYQLEGILVGPLNNMKAEISFYIRDKKDDRFILTSQMNNIFHSDKSIRGEISYKDFKSLCRINLGPDYLRASIISGKFLRGSVNIELLKDDKINANFYLDRFPINKFFADSIMGRNAELNGKIKVSGSVDNPRISAQINGDKFILNDIGYYKLNFDLTASKSDVTVDSISIGLNNYPIINGDMKIDLNTKNIYACSRGENIDLDYIWRTFSEKSNFIKGKSDYNILIKGSLSSPEIIAEIDIKDGNLDNIPFDKLTMRLKDSLRTNTDFFDFENHSIYISDCELIRSGQYHLDGNGSFPIYQNGQIDFDLHFDGDILSLLPKWEGFFIEGASFSTIDLKLTGTLKSPQIIKGIAQIDRGELLLKSVVKQVKNISGRIELEEGTNQINFYHFSAEVNGNPLVINTVRNITTSDGKKLKHWYFPDLDLDFGILALNTPKKGIECRIEGLMVDNKRGYISLCGKTVNENFYFAGPVSHPNAYGMVTLSDSRITFPFLGESGSKPNKVIEFLKSIEWNVLARASQDLCYSRMIPAILGEVDTELYLDPESPGLEFTGILNKGNFVPFGELYSSRGRINYLDLNFRIENFSVVFNRHDILPEVYGRAWTMVRDIMNTSSIYYPNLNDESAASPENGSMSRTIYLELYAIDPETKQEVRRARWEDFRFRLVSVGRDPEMGETQEEILAALGYSVNNIGQKETATQMATKVGGAVTENYLIRPILRPIERTLEKYLGFDYVRFNSAIARNLFYTSLVPKESEGDILNNNLQQKFYTPYLPLIQSSEVTVGKYLTKDLYFSYTGQLINVVDELNNPEFNINHSFGLEYRFFRNLLLELEYDRQKYSLLPYREQDFKIRLRHSFMF
jgi:hypothetical protein